MAANGLRWDTNRYRHSKITRSPEQVPNIFLKSKDAATGNLVTTVTADAADRRQSTSFINYYRFKNLTMILYGKLGNTGATAPKVAIMSNN